MTTWAQHQNAGNYTIIKLIELRELERVRGKKLFGGKKHKKMAKYYDSIINKLPDNPNSFDCASLPDWVLAKIGW